MSSLKYILVFVFILIVFLGWRLVSDSMFTHRSPSLLEASLQAAGDNRTELEKVLRRYQTYPADSLKYRAACFLIENMPFYSYEYGKKLEEYKTYYAWLKPSRGKTPEQVADSVKEIFGPIGAVESRRDVAVIDSAYLCNNIEWAFKVWHEQPWGKNVSFTSFCEYVLPHRIGDESLEYWREEYYEKYNSLLDSLRASDSLDVEDPVVAAGYLIERLPDKWHYLTSVTPYSFGHIGPTSVQYLSGTCQNVTDFAIYVFRALGIPCAVDFILVRNGINAGHFWLTTWDKYGEEYMSEYPGALGLVRERFWSRRDESPKKYRYTYSVNRSLHEQMAQYGEEVYPFWRIPQFVDVSHNYAYNFSEELIIPLGKRYKEKRHGKIAYLCSSSREQWIPVDWAAYDTERLIFSNVNKGAMLRVATYEDGRLCFVTDPFCIDKQNDEIYYYPNDKEGVEDVVLFAKSNIDGEDLSFRNRMVGGVFEGSNVPSFAIKDTLFVIQTILGRLTTQVKSRSDKTYRYVRYMGPPEGFCNVAEVSFYEKGETIPLSGKNIGTPGCHQRDGSHEHTNVFDGKTQTSFDYFDSYGGWAGLDLGEKKQIDRIAYTPRNRDNYIRLGDSYELFYCDKEWKSAGRMEATSDSLAYNGIPRHALLLLRNYTRGVDERIFIYEDGKQIWK